MNDYSIRIYRFLPLAFLADNIMFDFDVKKLSFEFETSDSWNLLNGVELKIIRLKY